jgi:hypothetical protein
LSVSLEKVVHLIADSSHEVSCLPVALLWMTMN